MTPSGSYSPLLLSFVVAALAGCSHPTPAPNAAALAVQAPPNVPLATQVTVGQEVGAVAANRVQVTFPQGGYHLTIAATKQLDVAARLFRDVNPSRMFVAGYSDTLGDDYYNLLLSARRAQAVKEGLVARGIPADRLLLQAYGTSEPASNGDQGADNRRVVVTWRII